MRLPEIPRQIPRKHRQQLQMLGLNYTDDYRDGECSTAIGVDTKRYPYITTISKPEPFPFPTGNADGDWLNGRMVHSMTKFKDKFFIIATDEEGNVENWFGDPSYFKRCDLIATAPDRPAIYATPGDKQYAVINNKLCIFPDCLYLDYDSTNTKVQRFGRRQYWKCSTGKVKFMNDEHGQGYIEFPAALSIDFRELFKDHLIPSTSWADKLEAVNGFKVFVSGTLDPGVDNLSLSVDRIGKRTIWFKAFGWDVTGITSGNITSEYYRDVRIGEAAIGGFDSDNFIPGMDFVCSHDNRIFGCCSADQTIYVSALGDPSDWYSFDTDVGAYAVAVGTDGPFTGCLSMNGYVFFTKQHHIHKLFGSYPSEYYIKTYNMEGCKEGCGGSLVDCGGTAVYMSEHGMVRYSGGYAYKLNKAIDPEKFSEPHAIYDGRRYILTCKYDGEYSVFEFDLEHNVVTQNRFDAICVTHIKDKTYCSKRSGGGVYLYDTDNDYSDGWQITYKPFIDTVAGTFNSESEIFEKKRYFKLYVRCEVTEGAVINGYLMVNGKKVEIGSINGPFKGVHTFVFLTDRFDEIELTLHGRGKSTILSIQREYQQKESSR